MANTRHIDPFVGREIEMELLVGALRDAEEGRSRVLSLIGEPGIGKTRLINELVRTASRKESITLTARCWNGGGAPPYWPWSQVLDQLVEKIGQETGREIFSNHAPFLTGAFPALSHMFPQLPEPSLPLDEARFQLYSNFAGLLKVASEHSLIVVVVDDIHDADDDSIGLLKFLVRSIRDTRLLAVVSSRDDDSAGRNRYLLARKVMAREPIFSEYTVAALGPAATKNLVSALEYSSPGGEIDLAIHAATDGNPFHIRELISSLKSHSSAVDHSTMQQITDHKRHAVADRVLMLSDTAQKTLKVAALIGLTFDISQIAKLCEPDAAEAVIAGLDEGVAGRIIEYAPSEASRLRFTHALYREAIATAIPLAERARMHARIGQEMERYFDEDAQAHAAELAPHFFEARVLLGEEKAVEYSRLAGDSALRASSPELAANYFQQALSAKQSGHDRQRAEIELLLARALGATTRRDEAAAHFRAAFDHFVAIGEKERAISIASYPIFYGFGSSVVTTVVEDALKLTRSGSVEQARLMSKRARQVYHRDMHYVRASSTFEIALEIAYKAEDIPLILATLADYGHVDGDELRYEANIGRLPEALRLLKMTDDSFSEFWVHHFAFESLFFTGVLMEAKQHADRVIEIAMADVDRSRNARAFLTQSYVNHASGNLEQALKFIQLVLGPRGVADDYVSLAAGVVNCTDLGDFSEAKKLLKRLRESGDQSTGGRAAIAIGASVYAVGTSDDDLVAEVLTTARSILADRQATPHWRESAAAGLGLIAIAHSDASMGSEAYERLVERSGTIIHAAAYSADRILGGLAALLGDPGSAVSHFEVAVALCSNGGYAAELARTQADYGEFLFASSSPSSQYKASELIRSAAAAAQKYKLDGMAARMKQLRDRTIQISASSVTKPIGLTPREIEVLKELTAGKSNREIAETLYISQNTVIRHVANIFSKTGVSNRAQAAVYAERSGIGG